MLRLQYRTDSGAGDRLYAVGEDLRCMADAAAVLASGVPVLIEPVGCYNIHVSLAKQEGRG